MASALAKVHSLASLPATAYCISSDLRQGLAALPRGSICEILGSAPSAGQMAIVQSMVATASAAGEVVAIVDCDDAYDPASAKANGADLSKLLWVQCGHRLDHALRAADMILHSGGFGLVVLDLCDASHAALNRAPLSYWHRFRRAVENTPCILLILARQSVAKSCATRQFALQQNKIEWCGTAPFETIRSVAIEAVSRKPMGMSPTRLDAAAPLD